MKSTLKKLIMLSLTLFLMPLRGYEEIKISKGQMVSFTKNYYTVVRREGGRKVRYAVKLTPQEISSLHSVLGSPTDYEFNKTISKSMIRRIMRRCGTQEICETMERVLHDFLGRQVEILFNVIGISRDI